ncbi:uncharacterized protein LOC109603601 [Aethina tumida]|uniref:uncharacterized protein LOC109603601 n=1 Tax=Aethina tumida TaxID=116153 RepID=UPI00096ADB83|nr:uncharacterized protein LOC109603601 [Aethina tumida]
MCPTLFESALLQVASNIHIYPDEDIEFLPVNIKDKLLLTITRSPTLTNKLNLNLCLPLLLHNRTRILSIPFLYKKNLHKLSEDLINQLYKCPELMVLILPDYMKCSPKALVNCFVKLPNLERLEMKHCDGVTHDVLKVLWRNCPKLRIKPGEILFI